ncbi:flagellar export chaperone FlgN [Fontivita pretiosa]|uniref:flagellar export chaperone FlgN n=1 Tax=Fontivita pretiosa TaxID=2989684 RepID=UPI003D165BC2
MSRQLIEQLEGVLQLLIDEHRRMLGHVESQQAAMRELKVQAVEDATHRQEASRMRIASLETRRRMLVQQIARLNRLDPQHTTLAQIAELSGQGGQRLLELRDELKGLIKQIADRTHIAGRLASAVLGHLNTAMRLFADAVGQAGTYTKHGTPRVPGRIGVMEAVG